jgi:hypothetical protein
MFFLQRNADILPLRMHARILIIPDIPALRRKDAMISSELAVFAGEPCCAALPEDDVAGDYVFACFASKSLAEAKGNGEGYVSIPPLFFAPRRFPGPSLAPLARPWV